MVISCSAYGCTNRWTKDKIRQFHRFPLNDPQRLKAWLNAMRRESFHPNKHSFLCSDHFTRDSYKAPSMRHLKKDAVPSIFNFPKNFQNAVQTRREIVKYPLPDMTECQKWKKVIPRADKELTPKDRICELHFLPEEINRHFVYNMPDNTQILIERERVNLKASAVPSVFPNLPSYLNKSKKTRKSPLETMSLPKKAKLDKSDKHHEISTNNEDCTIPEFSSTNIISNIFEIRKPNKFWSISSHENFINCVKWDVNFAPERQIIVDENLGIKVMYYGIEVQVKPTTTLDSTESLSQLVTEVDKYMVCPGAVNRNKNCCVFLRHELESLGRPKRWCKKCHSRNSRSQAE